MASLGKMGICSSYKWYNRWTTIDSNVACRQLGHMELGNNYKFSIYISSPVCLVYYRFIKSRTGHKYDTSKVNMIPHTHTHIHVNVDIYTQMHFMMLKAEFDMWFDYIDIVKFVIS